MTKRELIRVVCFLTIFSLILSYLTKLFYPKWTGKADTISRISTFYNQPKDSIDVLFMGASSIMAAIAPLQIWQDYGITGYVRASSTQAPAVTYNEFIEAMKYQHPKVLVLDGISLFDSYNVDVSEPFIRMSVDPMKLSLQKLDIIHYVLSHTKTQTLDSYIFPFLRYHSRWVELTTDDFKYDSHLNMDYQKGAYIRLHSNQVEIPDDFMKIQGNEKPESLDQESLNYYKKIINICKEKDIDVVLVSFPKSFWTYSRHLALEDFTSENKIAYIDYNMPKDMSAIQFNPETDYNDEGHVSANAAKRISTNIGAYLKNNYGLPDHRNDPKYVQWDKDLQKFQKLFE